MISLPRCVSISIPFATRANKGYYILRCRRMKVCVIAVALAVTAATGEMSMALSATAAEQRDQRVLDLLVIDQATRKPIPGVSLAIQKFRDDQRVRSEEHTSELQSL